MTPPKNRAKDNTEPIERLARSVDLLVKLKVEELKGERNQREMIRFLYSLGAGGAEITAMLGISRSTVDPELSKLRKGKKQRKD